MHVKNEQKGMVTMEQGTTEETVNNQEGTNTEVNTNAGQGTEPEVNAEPNTVDNNNAGAEGAKTDEGEGNTSNKADKDIMIPKERFDEVNNKYKELSNQMKAMEEAKNSMEKQIAEMKESNTANSTEVDETTKKLEGQVEQYESVMNELIDTKMQAIPEEMQDLIPDGLSVEQRLSWINKAEEKGLFRKQNNVVVGQPLNHSSEQEKAEKLSKMNPRQLFASVYGGNT